MGNDELCILSAIRLYYGGPSLLFSNSEGPEIAEIILRSWTSSPHLPKDTFSTNDLQATVNYLIETHATLGNNVGVFPWKAYCDTKWDGFLPWVAIGQFDEDNFGNAPWIEAQSEEGTLRHRAPLGREVVVRRVRNTNSGFDFAEYWDEEAQCWKDGVSGISPYMNNVNIVCHKAPLAYLKSWINWTSLPPRSIAFPDDPEALSIKAELYEIVNSRKRGRGDVGALRFLDYGGIEKTLVQYQDIFRPTWDGSTRHLERAIRDGRTGEGLMVALSRDFGAWMCVRTDVWPMRTARQALALPANTSQLTEFNRIPAELLIEILCHLDPVDYAALLSVSRSLRHILQSGVLDATVKSLILTVDGPLRWILPVESMEGEEDTFQSACATWLQPPSKDEQLTESKLIRRADFPHYAFLAEAWVHDSMRNRRRLWTITKQLELLWVDYRTKGWENNIFVPHDEDEADYLEESEEDEEGEVNKEGEEEANDQGEEEAEEEGDEEAEEEGDDQAKD
ncbi:hypothetical protein HGRIS_004023 [Hohenbuehelia grisea]|uniref:F-box domain-containing protein n=1 Tax=Hohenbuehelia grisea TaxID=104357 RepID=A0ABR3JHF4_9AGAR